MTPGIIAINRHMRTRSREQVAKFLALTGLAGELSFDTLLPFRYESRWGDGSFINFSGVFERPDWAGGRQVLLSAVG